MYCLLILAALRSQCLYQVQQNMRSQLLEHWYELIEAVGKNPQEPISIAIVGGANGVELSWRIQSHLHRILHQTQQLIQNLEIHLFQRDNAQYPISSLKLFN